MRRRIKGFHEDEVGDWVAELSCLHGQHVRHRPPFRDRPWVLDAAGRADRIGTDLDCSLCDRAELPPGLHRSRTAGPFDQESLPAGLRRVHRVAEATWGRLVVLEGDVGLWMATDPPIERRLGAGDEQALPPDVAHRLILDGPTVLAVEFLVANENETASDDPTDRCFSGPC